MTTKRRNPLIKTAVLSLTLLFFSGPVRALEDCPKWLFPSEIPSLGNETASRLKEQGWRFLGKPILKGDFNRDSIEDLVFVGKKGERRMLVVLWSGTEFIEPGQLLRNDDPRYRNSGKKFCDSRLSGIESGECGTGIALKTIGKDKDGIQLTLKETVGYVAGKPQNSTWTGKYFCREGNWHNDGDMD